MTDKTRRAVEVLKAHGKDDAARKATIEALRSWMTPEELAAVEAVVSPRRGAAP